MKTHVYIIILMALTPLIFNAGSPTEVVAQSKHIGNGPAVDSSVSSSGKFLSRVNCSNIVLPIIPLDTDEIEASAVLYFPEEDQYLMISDETPDNLPLLFLMDGYGRILREILLPGPEEIIDMESITMDDQGTIYIAASLSENDNGNVPQARRSLITLQKHQTELTFNRRIDLYSMLTECASDSPQQPWAEFITESVSEGDLDVEGMFWHQGALFLGFKSPLADGRSTILKIDQAARMLDSQELNSDQVSIWKQFSLSTDLESGQELITDLFLQNGYLYLTGVPESRESGDFSGSLWRLNLTNDQLTRVIHYSDLKPEGIAATSTSGTLLLCFDQGENHLSQITRIQGVK